MTVRVSTAVHHILSLLFSLIACLLLTADTVGVAEEIVSGEYLRRWKQQQFHCRIVVDAVKTQEILTPISEDFCTIQNRHLEESARPLFRRIKLHLATDLLLFL